MANNNRDAGGSPIIRECRSLAANSFDELIEEIAAWRRAYPQATNITLCARSTHAKKQAAVVLFEDEIDGQMALGLEG